MGHRSIQKQVANQIHLLAEICQPLLYVIPTSWEIDGETVEAVSDFTFWGSKITAGDDCSHEIKRCLLLGRKVMTNLDSILKSRHYLANKSPSSQGYGFPSGHVWM